MRIQTIVLGAVLALQSAWVLGTSWVHERALREGQVVLLETRPVDPRDLLRGDYVILNYEISTIPANLFTPPLAASLPSGTVVHVVLEQTGEFHRAVQVSTEPLAASPGQTIIQGRLQSAIDPGLDNVRIVYGLERYYVREGTGNPIGKLTVLAAIPASGQARIKQVFIDGKPYAEVMRQRSEP